jgi:TatD DNase family protein
MFIDLHTHNAEHDERCIKIVSSNTLTSAANTLFSAGIHPWDISDSWQEDIQRIAAIAGDKRVVAIGECGIDKIKSLAGIETQKEVLKAHIAISEKEEKPLILHCVKGFDSIIALHKESRPRQAWIIHGFRGKPEQAAQLLREGFYLSYGEKHNHDSLVATPLDRLFIESDTSTTSIGEIYHSIAMELGTSTEALMAATQENATKCNIRTTAQ